MSHSTYFGGDKVYINRFLNENHLAITYVNILKGSFYFFSHPSLHINRVRPYCNDLCELEDLGWFESPLGAAGFVCQRYLILPKDSPRGQHHPISHHPRLALKTKVQDP